MHKHWDEINTRFDGGISSWRFSNNSEANASESEADRWRPIS